MPPDCEVEGITGYGEVMVQRVYVDEVIQHPAGSDRYGTCVNGVPSPYSWAPNWNRGFD